MASPDDKKLRELLGIPDTKTKPAPADNNKLRDLLGIPSTATPAPAPADYKPISVLKEEEELALSNKKLDDRRTDFTRQRVQELTGNTTDPINRIPLTTSEAAIRADKEFSEQFLQPMTTQFGDAADRSFGFFGFDMAGPAGYIPPRELRPVGEPSSAALLSGALAPQREVVAGAQVEAARNLNTIVDWDSISTELANQKIPTENIDAEIAGLKSAFNYLRSLEPNRNPGDIMSEVIEARNKLPDVLAGKDEVIRGEVRRGLEEPWRQTVWRQRVEGQVPDLSPVQTAYMSAQIEAIRAATAAAQIESLQGATKRMFELKDGSLIEPSLFDPDFDAGFVRQVDVPLTKEEIEAKGEAAANVRAPNLWWANEETKKEVLANPEKFYETGLFETSTPFGETIETPVGWALRALVSIPNAFAGAVSEVLTNLPTEAVEAPLQAERIARREADQPVFKDHPVLYNIARNRGFAGEAMEASDILQKQNVISPGTGFLLSSAGFVLDFLDPSLPAIGAGAKALKIGAQTTKATKALRGVASAGEAASRAVHAGAAEFIDLWAPFNSGAKISSKIQPGDLRIALAADLTNSQAARLLATQLAEQGEELAGIKKAVTERFGVNSYTKSLDSLSDEAFNALESANKRYAIRSSGIKAGSREARLLDDTDAYVEELNKMANGTSAGGTAVRLKDLARDIGAIATVSPEVRSVIAAVDAASGTGPKMVRYLQALKSEGMLSEVVGQHLFSASLSEIMNATPNMRGLDKMVQVTNNTWAPSGSQAKILSFVKNETRAGKLAQDLVEQRVPVVTISTPRGVETFYDFSKHPALKAEYESVFRQMQDFEQLSGGRIEIVKGKLNTADIGLDNLASSLVRTKDFRNVLDATIDMTAEGLQVSNGRVTGEGIMRARDAARLAIGRQIDLLEPLENRSFSQSVFKDVWRKVVGIFEPTQANLTITQRQFFRRANNEVSTMDITLRKDMIRFANDPEYRLALGADPKLDVSSLSKEEILGYLTIKKVLSPSELAALGYTPETIRELFNVRDAEAITQTKDMLKWTAGRFIFAEGAKESLDILGSRLVFSDMFLSEKGTTALDDLIKITADKMYTNPANYVAEYNAFLREWYEAVSDNPEYILAAHRDSRLRTLADAPPNSLMLGSYYKIEADRIINKTLQDIFAADTSASKGIFGETFDTNYRRELTIQLTKLSAVPLTNAEYINFADSIWSELVRIRLTEIARDSIGIGDVARSLDNPTMLRASLTSTIEAINPIADAASAPNAVRLMVDNLLKDSEFVTAYSNLIVQSDDVAKSIARKNGFIDPSTTASIIKNSKHKLLAIEEMFAGESALTKGLIGEDAFAEIQKAVTENGFDHIEAWFRESARINSSGWAKKIAIADRILRNINEWRYTFVLGMRPRFHGVNAMTAPMIIYSTIGASPASSLGMTGISGGVRQTAAVKSAATLAAQTGGPGSPAWNATAVIDAAGRRYTYGDVFENIIAGGGVRSAMSFEVSQAMIDDAMRIVPANKREAISNTAGSLARLTQYEDNFFRLNIAYGALMEGRSMEEATALARRSLYDYGDLTSAEKFVAARMLIFYSFTRQLVTQTLRNISTPRGWIRLTNMLKSERAATQFAQNFYGNDDQSTIWMPDYTMTRPIWTKATGDAKDMYQIGPSFAPNEGVVFLATLLSAGPSELITKQLHPNIAIPLGLSTFEQSTKQIQPHHVAMLTATESGMSLFESFVGGRIEAVRASPEEGAVNGYIYPLTEQQEISYKKLLNLGQFLGTSTFTRDMARTFGFTDEPGLETVGDRAAFGIGLQTPIKVERPTKQKVRETDKRAAEVGKTIKERKDR